MSKEVGLLYEITCATPKEQNGVIIGLQSIGGYHSDGSFWQLTEEEAIAQMEGEEKVRFYLRAEKLVAEVHLHQIKGRKLLRSRHGTRYPDYLFSLPECPNH